MRSGMWLDPASNVNGVNPIRSGLLKTSEATEGRRPKIIIVLYQLPSLSKIWEQTIFQQLSNYMTDNNLFDIEEYGFRSGHSTELAALHLIDHLTKKKWMLERYP